jgi:hypothetical protein
MAGTGALQALGKDLYIKGMQTIFNKARVANLTGGTITSMSNLYTISYESSGSLVEQAVMSANIVFALTTTGTVNIIALYNSSSQLTGYFDVTPVVYATATYYTLSEFLVDIV